MVSRISMRTSYLAGVVILVGTAVAVAQPEKWSDPPYIQLSKNMTPDVRDLPSLGSIDWTLMRIPFIDDSPRAGISIGTQGSPAATSWLPQLTMFRQTRPPQTK